ncbi:hypothetical protein ScPMuIL_013189 [Solemya velum]
MPSEKFRSKEDTWRTDELKKALKDGQEREQGHRVNSGLRPGLTDDEREKQRRERREKREKKDTPDKTDKHHKRKDEKRTKKYYGNRTRRHGDREKNDDRERQRHHRDKESDRDRHRDRDAGSDGHKDRDKDREKDRDRHKEKRSDHDKHRDRDRDRRDDRAGDRDRHRVRESERDKHKDRQSDRDVDRERHRDRQSGRERDRDGDHPREKDRDRERKDDDRKHHRRIENGDKNQRHDLDEEDRERQRQERRDRREKERQLEKEKKDGHEQDRRERKERKERQRFEEDERELERQERRERKERERQKKEDPKERKLRHEEKKIDKRKTEEQSNHHEKPSRYEDESEKRKQKSENVTFAEEKDDYEDDFEDYEEDFEEDDDDDGDDDGSDNQKKNSEMDDLLKALDAENDRLIQESRQEERRSAAFKDNGYDDYEGYQKESKSTGQTFINFTSAKERAITAKSASKTRQRGNDLLNMIELDVSSFSIFDLPPVREYDLYIRSFGRTNTKQAYVQVNDDDISREVQTEPIDYLSKWTQHPPEDFRGSGRGDGEKDFDEEEKSLMAHKEDPGHLNKFLQRSAQVISILLDEETIVGYAFLKGRHVHCASFSQMQSNLVLIVYSDVKQGENDDKLSTKGVLCVWNINDLLYPQNILVCDSQPTCCCFSPVKANLAFAGMSDGSVSLWDLKESVMLHRSERINDQDHVIRFPTYSTACVLGYENHCSPVTNIKPVIANVSMGQSFQLISMDENAVLNFWVVAEILIPDLAGSESDLGLAPGGKFKLLKSSTVIVQNSIRPSVLNADLKACDLQLMPSDPNQFFIGTDMGYVMHGVRFGSHAHPRKYSSTIENPVMITSIDFSPFDEPCFLVGCADGCVHMFNTKSEKPIVSLPRLTNGNKVVCVRWSCSRPCVFFVLDDDSNIWVVDIIEGDTTPTCQARVAQGKVVCLELSVDHSAMGVGIPGRKPQMLLGFETGLTEIHTLTRQLQEQQPLETEFLRGYLERF